MSVAKGGQEICRAQGRTILQEGGLFSFKFLQALPGCGTKQEEEVSFPSLSPHHMPFPISGGQCAVACPPPLFAIPLSLFPPPFLPGHLFAAASEAAAFSLSSPSPSSPTHLIYTRLLPGHCHHLQLIPLAGEGTQHRHLLQRAPAGGNRPAIFSSSACMGWVPLYWWGS